MMKRNGDSVMKTASKIVRAIVKEQNRRREAAGYPGNLYVFNDKRTFGRSIKVWGWAPEDYMNAERQIRAAGMVAEIREFDAARKVYNPVKQKLEKRIQQRLWVYDPA